MSFFLINDIRLNLPMGWVPFQLLYLGPFSNVRCKLQSIAKVEPIFSGFRTIQANKEAQRRRLMEITGDGQTVKHELDSLIAIPRKSHADSIGIIRRYRQLEQIVKSLKHNDNNEKN